MLIISSKTPTTSRRCFNQIEAAWLAGKLVANSVSFYCEPEPEGMYLFIVNDEAGHVVDRLMRKGGLKP